MRLTILALSLSAGTAAFCQSVSPAPANLSPQVPARPQWAQPGQDFSAQPRQWHFNPDLPQRTMILPAPAPMRKQETAQIDPMIVMHPPPSSIGEQAPGSQIAQNLYPGLMLMPIDQWKGNGQQIPIAWPDLKVKNIPTVWPKIEIKPVGGAATEPAGK